MSGNDNPSFRHGASKRGQWTITYYSYVNMKARCLYPSMETYKYYGALGVTVCERWKGKGGFANFLADVGERPTREHTIDRWPNKEGNYEPGNCRWATKKQQAQNRRPRNSVYPKVSK